MISKYLISISLISFLGSGVAHTQSSQYGLNLHDHQLIKVAKQGLKIDEAALVEGTAYLNENFEAGDVQTGQGNFKTVPMRYDIFHDQIEFKQNDNVYILDPDPNIVKITLSDHGVMVVERSGNLK